MLRAVELRFARYFVAGFGLEVVAAGGGAGFGRHGCVGLGGGGLMWELVDCGSWILRYTAVASVTQSANPAKPLRVSLTLLSPFGLTPCVFLISFISVCNRL